LHGHHGNVGIGEDALDGRIGQKRFELAHEKLRSCMTILPIVTIAAIDGVMAVKTTGNVEQRAGRDLS
jgi:hypothetical protein